MKTTIEFRTLGITITPETPQDRIAELCAKYPEVKTKMDKLNNSNDVKKASKEKGTT